MLIIVWDITDEDWRHETTPNAIASASLLISAFHHIATADTLLCFSTAPNVRVATDATVLVSFLLEDDAP